MLLQGVHFWSFWDHPQAVALEVVSEGCVVIQDIISMARVDLLSEKFWRTGMPPHAIIF